MSSKEYISPDELFRQNLENAEADFEPAAWEHMQTLLDKDEAVRPVGFLFGFNLKNHKVKFIITMSTVLLLSGLAGWLHYANVENYHSGTARVSQTEKHISVNSSQTTNSGSEEIQISEKGKTGEKSVNPAKKSTAAFSSNSQKTSGREKQNGEKSVSGQSKERGSLQSELAGKAGNQSAENVRKPLSVVKNTMPVNGVQAGVSNFYTPSFKTPVRFATPLFPAPVVKTSPLYFSADSSVRKPFRKYYPYFDGFIGIHFTSQRPITLLPQDSNRQNAGFNVQFMSNDLLNTFPWGGYLGFDFGMQFYGRGQRTNVQLNTNSGDSGWTRLSTISFDFLARGHVEFATGKVIPYVTAFAGPRLYSTNQRVQSYLPLKETESGSSNNAYTTLSFMYGVGGGLRVRLSDVVSLDFRGEYMAGTPVNLVDLDKSTFNGLTYDLKKYKMNPEYLHLKFGVLFNLGSDENFDTHNQTVYRQPNYIYQNNETRQEYEYYDSSTGKWIALPMCPCNCDSTGKKIDPSLIRKKTTEGSGSYRNGSSYQSGWELSPPAVRGSSPSSGRVRRSGSSWPTPSAPSGSGKGSFPGIKPSSGGGIKIKS